MWCISKAFWLRHRVDRALEGGLESRATKTPNHTSQTQLSIPISRDVAILSLRYPISCDTFPGRLALPQNGAIHPPLVLSFTQAHLCDTPFCKISHDNCAVPHKNKHERVWRYYRYKYCAVRKVSLLVLLETQHLGPQRAPNPPAFTHSLRVKRAVVSSERYKFGPLFL